VLCAALLLPCGCSSLIARSGLDLSEVHGKDQVHELFGEPVASGTIDGQPYEDYLTRRKISEDTRATAQEMAIIMVGFGALEFVALPREIYLLGERGLLGQQLRFTYEANGEVSAVYLDGEALDIWKPLGRP
jgi:hypothetical protein